MIYKRQQGCFCGLLIAVLVASALLQCANAARPLHSSRKAGGAMHAAGGSDRPRTTTSGLLRGFYSSSSFHQSPVLDRSNDIDAYTGLDGSTLPDSGIAFKSNESAHMKMQQTHGLAQHEHEKQVVMDSLQPAVLRSGGLDNDDLVLYMYEEEEEYSSIYDDYFFLVYNEAEEYSSKYAVTSKDSAVKHVEQNNMYFYDDFYNDYESYLESLGEAPLDDLAYYDYYYFLYDPNKPDSQDMSNTL